MKYFALAMCALGALWNAVTLVLVIAIAGHVNWNGAFFSLGLGISLILLSIACSLFELIDQGLASRGRQ